MTQTTNKENYFFSQPHQPFFILGIVNAIVMMLIFALSYKGIFSINISSLGFHTYSLIFTMFVNVFTGFIFTTYPRFCQAQTIEKAFYIKIFFANLVGSILFLYGTFTEINIMKLGMIVLLISQAFIVYKLHTIYKTGKAVDKLDAFWILVSNYFGLLGHILFIASTFSFSLESFSIKLSFYMYLIFLTFTVGQRMIPFFSHSFAIKSKKLVVIVFSLFLLKTIFSSFDIKIAEILIDLVLGLYLLREFINWKFTPLSEPAILWVLHLGLFWLPAALFLSALSLSAELYLGTSFYFLGVHLLAIGFLTTILIGFGTRVTLGHSGQAPDADKFAVGIFIFIQAVVILRTLFSINVAAGWGLNFLFDISFTAWLVLFILWGARFAKVLIFGTKL